MEWSEEKEARALKNLQTQDGSLPVHPDNKGKVHQIAYFEKYDKSVKCIQMDCDCVKKCGFPPAVFHKFVMEDSH